MNVCADCERPLCRRNVSGLCRGCSGRRTIARMTQEQKQAASAARSAAMRKFFAMNPEMAAIHRERLRAMTQTPEHSQRSREGILRRRIWEQGLPLSQTPEARAKRAVRNRENAVSWCPPARRDEYRELVRRKRLTAAEARAVIVADEQAKVRRKFG